MVRLSRFFQRTFILWVLLGATWGYLYPKTSATGARWIPQALAIIMLGMGLTLTPAELRNLRTAQRWLLPGIFMQYTLMPLLAWGLAWLFRLPAELAVGVILVGAAPGGTASNVVTLLARGNVALSVAMTTMSTLLSLLLTPLWVWLLASQWLPVQPAALLWSVVQIVLLPVMLGVLARKFLVPSEFVLEGVLPLISMLVIAWIVGVIVGLNRPHILESGVVMTVVAVHNLGGYALGWLGARLTGADARVQRTIAIEVGMQNSGLAVALATAHVGPLAAMPGAVFSVFQNLSGAVLVSLVRLRQAREPKPETT